MVHDGDQVLDTEWELPLSLFTSSDSAGSLLAAVSTLLLGSIEATALFSTLHQSKNVCCSVCIAMFEWQLASMLNTAGVKQMARSSAKM